jgi:O-antigen biosynthesis protein
MLEIILVRYGQLEYETEAIEQVLAKTDVPYHLTVYDNYDRDGNLSTVWNELIRRSDADYICLLNTDTVVSDKWASMLLETFNDPKVGAVGPVANRAGGYQGGWKEAGIGQIEYPVLSGFCLFFPKKVWEEVGGFNEKYKLYGEDSEFTNEIKRKGYRLIIRHDVWIFHYGGKSTEAATKKGKDIQAIQKESARKYQEYIHGK